MKSSWSQSHRASKDDPQQESSECDDDDSESASTDDQPSPRTDEPPTAARLPFARRPPARLSEVTQSASPEKPRGDATTAVSSIKTVAGEKPSTRVGVSSEDVASRSKKPGSSDLQVDLTKLKDAVNAKILHQHRTRGSPEVGSVLHGTMKRVSPIHEEAGSPVSSSLDAVFDGSGEPMRSASAVSTGSTGSQKTVRGSAAATPFQNVAVRTPSYPFPYVPGTPKAWSANFHRPFTLLSPTGVSQPQDNDAMPGKINLGYLSGSSTPVPASAFLPPNLSLREQEDPRFPTPNLYDMVLQLSAEPGMEQWWVTVTNMMHDHFKAERATLVLPLDATDIENVPWGQKAIFNMSGPEEFVSRHTVAAQTAKATKKPELGLREPSFDIASDMRPQKLHAERIRPRLEMRHSYAGQGREVRDAIAAFGATSKETKSRPQGPQRTATHTPGIAGPAGTGRFLSRRVSNDTDQLHVRSNDLDFSSVSGMDHGPYAEIFPAVRALNQESAPLIESGGINRVLERGRMVTITRDYVSDSTQAAPSYFTPDFGQTLKPSKAFGDYRSAFASDNNNTSNRERHDDYEDYEQHATSPWTQSPAPSPAIQANEDTNPFFASEEQQVEDSFNPASSPDYSQAAQIEAIGVDHASTVIHIPLVHPILSPPMQPRRMKSQRKDSSDPMEQGNTVDVERKAPIAILSVLSPTVPYPTNLIQSLKLLGPHLATSFAVAQQFSSSQLPTVNIRHRRTMSGRTFDFAPMTVEPKSLEDIVHADLEEPMSSISGSITSPSDYSGRSLHSPSGSIVGTPGWDPASHGWTASKSVGGTPALTGTEMVDNYFESKKQSSYRTTSNTSATSQATPRKPGQKRTSGDSASTVSPESESKTPRSERKTRMQQAGGEEKILGKPPIENRDPLGLADATSPHRPGVHHMHKFVSASDQSRPHSMLHSYGADYQSTFGILPSSNPGLPASSRLSTHARKTSYSDDMPPPSERLLRTIIDSVPVQFFTAQPESGDFSWVNSRFLIYRGLEPRQILSDPWQAMHPDDRGDFLPAWHRSLRTDQQLQQKVRLQRFDGSYRWFYVRAAPLRDKRQKVVHWIGTMMDFHEQHIAELNSARQQETEASERKYRALANSSPQIVFAVNRSKGVTFCNSQWLDFSGQTEAQALGVGFMDHVHPDDLAKCRLPTFEEGSNQPTNVPTSVPPEFTRTKSQSAASSSGSSETERGPNSESSTSFTPQMPQRKLSELASTGILKVGRDSDGRPSYSTEIRLKSKDGNYRWHLVRVLLAEPLFQADAEEETWYGTSTDIDDHKTLERDLKETMDEKSHFLSNMSHEIRTPLNGITGMVNFLIDSNLTAEQMEHVNIIRTSTEGLRGLINNILDLSKAEAGKIQLNKDWVYVRALIEEVNDLTSSMALDKGLELNYLVQEDVPAQIKGDRFRIRQILLNTVGNAIKFTTKGEVFVRCSLKVDVGNELGKDETFIKFEILDTGPGFNDKEAEHLFKRFSQIDGSSTRQHGGSGLGLVISKQLAQLHGGDMSATGIPDKGSNFTFFIRTTVPSKTKSAPALTSGAPMTSERPISPSVFIGPTGISKFPKTSSAAIPSEAQPKPSPKYGTDVFQSPSPYLSSPDIGKVSPSVSSASSDPSLHSAARSGSLRSERSSASSYLPEVANSNIPMKLTIPTDASGISRPLSTTSDTSIQSDNTHMPPLTTSRALSLTPPMYSILVVAPLKYSREATVHHIEKTLPENIPHQITARENFEECQEILGGEDPVIFTHVVIVLQDVEKIIALMDQILGSTTLTTSIVLITDLAQRKEIMEQAPTYDYEQLVATRRLRYVFKPLKPSRVGLIFDPQKEREMSLDRNQDSAQQVALSQKQVFEELIKRLGNKGKRVLLVEDNKVNQMVLLKFLAKASIATETVLDGVQCTDLVFAKPHGYYSIILCDLHMPNKDGYQTCKEIRKWEKKKSYPHLPIIALSANVLGDVYQKCIDAGFNSYITKPVDFKELSTVLMTFMDPTDPTKPHAFMKHTSRKHGVMAAPPPPPSQR